VKFWTCRTIAGSLACQYTCTAAGPSLACRILSGPIADRLNAATSTGSDKNVCSKNDYYLEEMHPILGIRLKEKFDTVHENIHN